MHRGTDRHLYQERKAQRHSGWRQTQRWRGLYLHIKAQGKYWRMAYRIHAKQKTLYIGIYPTLSLVQARSARDTAKALLAQGTDPSTATREAK